MSESPREAVILVPHTHWDREWYEPFPVFRLRLVDLLDDVLARAERDSRFRFTLDGQMAAVTDYLEIRPEAAELLTSLVESGQLAIGPWQILLDEFLCSGETIVRNLQLGWATARRFGGPMPVGYLPDMFGHVAQMPQILARAGLRLACVWRGVPHAVDRHAFMWEAPDGSRVRTEYLPGGYGNAVDLLTDPGAVARRAGEFVERMRPWFGPDPVLAMHGSDHTAPLPTLLQAVDDLAGGPVDLRLGTLAEYLAGADPDGPGLPQWAGELRSHAQANILPGVLSARVGIKRAMAAAERMVSRYAEPLTALWFIGNRTTSPIPRYLEMAWARLVDASCHDSVTGCGSDETAVAVAARVAEAEQFGRAVRDRVLARLAAEAPSEGVLVVNPSPTNRGGLLQYEVVVPEQWAAVSVELPDGRRAAAQEAARHDRTLFEQAFPGDTLATAVRRRTFGQVMFGRRVVSYEIQPDATTPSVTFHVSPVAGNPTYDVHTAADRISQAAASRPGEWLLRVLDAPARTLLADVAVPALGWAAVRPVEGTAPTLSPPVRVDAAQGVLDNSLVQVTVGGDGTVRVASADGTTLDGLGRIVDGGDAGDLYNYAPPARDVVVDAPVSVTMETVAEGPVLGAYEVRRTYRWPRRLGQDRVTRVGQAPPVEVVTRVELRSGEPFVRLEFAFDNHCLDHRVRVHLPLPRAATASHAEGQFAVVERGLAAEGGSGELPVPTFPAYSFVDAGGAAVLLDQATEYELVDAGRTLALTLLRAVGQISRDVHAWREAPAGPELATPQAQCRGPVMTRFAVLPHAGGWERDGVLNAAERYRHDFAVVGGKGKAGARLPQRTGLEVTGAGVVLSGLYERDGWLELRLVAESSEATVATVSGEFGDARRVDLLGEPIEDLESDDSRLELPMAPWEIATVQLRP